MKKSLLWTAASVAMTSQGAFAATEIALAHDLAGASAQSLKAMVARFNGAQQAYKVNVVERAADSQAAMVLLRAGDGAKLLGSSGAVVPLHQVMAQAGEKLDATQLSTALITSASDASGRLQALPLAYSAPVMFYNRALFKRAGLNPDNPPKTWMELAAAANSMFDAGVACPYTSSHPAWVHVESTSTMHNEPYAQGTGKATRVSFNTLIQVKHVAMMTSWVKGRFFHVFGRGAEADDRFAKGECGVLTASSSSYPELKKAPSMDLGVAAMPYHDDVPGANRGVNGDGDALWVMTGHSPAEYKAAARFVAYLLEPRNQADWVASTGYLPMLRNLSLPNDGDAMPAVKLAMREAGANTAAPLPVAAQEKVRDVVNEELEAVWANRKPPKEGLDNAVQRANGILAGLGIGSAVAATPAAAPAKTAVAPAAHAKPADKGKAKH